MAKIAPFSIDKKVQNGTPCFAGTRVKVRSLFDALKHDRPVEYFLAQFPAVTRDQVEAILDCANDCLTNSEHTA